MQVNISLFSVKGQGVFIREATFIRINTVSREVNAKEDLRTLRTLTHIEWF